MNKKTILSILIVLIILILLATCLVLTGCGKSKEDENKEVAKLVDEYEPFEFTFKYPKDAGYEFEADLESIPYVQGTLTNEEKNVEILFIFGKVTESSFKTEKESNSKESNYAETNYTSLGGYEYINSTGFRYYGINLLDTLSEENYFKVTVRIDQHKGTGSADNIIEFSKSEEFKEILKSMSLNLQIEGKKIDGIISTNHKLIVKNIENPDESKYDVKQYTDANGIMNLYRLKNGKYDEEGASFRLTYYGNTGNCKDLDTYLAHQEKVFKKKFVDYTLFGQQVKVDVSKYEIGESAAPQKCKMWISGLFEKDGKVFEFLYIQYVGIDDSIGEKLVNNVLNNFTIQD